MPGFLPDAFFEDKLTLSWPPILPFFEPNEQHLEPFSTKLLTAAHPVGISAPAVIVFSQVRDRSSGAWPVKGSLCFFHQRSAFLRR
jgi:hypothetical protein